MSESTAPERGSHRQFWVVIAIAVAIVAVDQLTKWWAIENLSDGEVIPVIGEWLRFVLVYNPGAAFGIGGDFTWILAVLAVLAAIAVGWYAWRVKSVAWTIVLGMILGGAITHAGDRLFRDPGFAHGHVVDFIGYGNLFVGNVADIMIVGGAIFAVLLVLFRVDTGRHPETESEQPDPEEAPEVKAQ
ncbi:signal peptidase II [Microbacteriaceae bacterium SG_E_30_P1]|uniref:Lipoprotein signal peptidase n=1 Tax=Antiquaquibacter oligotrophicus TaxID=2880260 RepID=A0ABT6KRB5_9MICO|nr:signal peptidase II [Antiquaquibacter oligotrophicus]MDH6182527.1 signal peptidase II [Antiquaquibacter oligotrophicus]UDF14504.1 signal peptidase II [Antiquaquibacter oligotrophicus]